MKKKRNILDIKADVFYDSIDFQEPTLHHIFRPASSHFVEIGERIIFHFNQTVNIIFLVDVDYLDYEKNFNFSLWWFKINQLNIDIKFTILIILIIILRTCKVTTQIKEIY